MKIKTKIFIGLSLLLVLAGGTIYLVKASQVVVQSGGQDIVISDIEKGLIAHYPLDQDSLKSATVTADTTPNSYDGTITAGASAGFVADQRGVAARAYDFDGANTTIPTTLTSNADFQNGFTLSSWIYADSDGELDSGRIIDKSSAFSALNGLNWGIYNNKLFSIVNNGTVVFSAVNSITYSVWTHVLVTVASNALVTFYINDVVSGTPATTGVLSGITTTNPLTIGNRSGATDITFDGLIDDVRIYNRVLSAGEVSQLYNSYRPSMVISDLEKGLIGHWTLDQQDLKSSTVIADVTPYGNDGTITGATFTTDRKGQANKAMSFNGTSDYVSIPNSASLNIIGPGSIGVWINITSWKTNYDQIIWKKGASWADIHYGILRLATNTFFVGALSDGTNYLAGAGPRSSTITLGLWYHLVFTWNGSVAKMFTNGVETGSVNTSILPKNEIANILMSSFYKLNGLIDDVRIYNRALSAGEIQQLYLTYR